MKLPDHLKTWIEKFSLERMERIVGKDYADSYVAKECIKQDVELAEVLCSHLLNASEEDFDEKAAVSAVDKYIQDSIRNGYPDHPSERLMGFHAGARWQFEQDRVKLGVMKHQLEGQGKDFPCGCENRVIETVDSDYEGVPAQHYKCSICKITWLTAKQESEIDRAVRAKLRYELDSLVEALNEIEQSGHASTCSGNPEYLKTTSRVWNDAKCDCHVSDARVALAKVIT